MSKKELAVRRPLKRAPTHPGELLAEELHELRLSIPAAAAELNVSRQLLHRIVTGKGPVSPEMALRIGRWLGNGPDLWMSMQVAYDLWNAQHAMADELKTIPTRAVA